MLIYILPILITCAVFIMITTPYVVIRLCQYILVGEELLALDLDLSNSIATI